jgi:pimeloyl-ACP methyl ester carboxylesterase
MATSDGTVSRSATTRAAGRQAPSPAPGPTLPTVLLLHGQPGSALDWQGVLAALGQGVTALAFDRPGWDGRRGARDLQGNAEAALEVLDAHGVDRALIVGHSLGGAIAAWLAARYPRRVSALVLAAPAANTDALYALDRLLAAPIAGELSGAASLAMLGLGLTLPMLRRSIAASAGIDEGYLSAARRLILRPSAWHSYAAEQRTLVRQLPELERRLSAIKAPTTILAGAQDRIVAPRAARRLAEQIPHARLRVSPGAGHLLPQCHPQLVAAAVTGALAEAV